MRREHAGVRLIMGLRAKSENVGSSRFLDAGLDGPCRRGWGGSIDTRRAVDGRLEHVAFATAEAVRQAIIGAPAPQPPGPLFLMPKDVLVLYWLFGNPRSGPSSSLCSRGNR